MRAVDTNVLVRLIAADDEAQLKTAHKLLEEPFLILPTVVLEAVWVLSNVYRLPRSMIVDRLTTILGYSLASVVSGEALNWTLVHFLEGADFADMLHVALAADAEASSFATFDKSLASAAGDASLVIETLT